VSTTEWNNLSNGLIGAAIGAIIGSLLGFLGSYVLNFLDQRSKQKAAGRALLAEIIRNLTALGYVGDHRPAGYSQNIWETQLSLVAALLNWAELQIVAEPYLLAAEPMHGYSIAETMREKGFQVAQSSSPSFSATFRSGRYAGRANEIIKKSQIDLEQVKGKFAKAAKILARKLLTSREADEFEPQLIINSKGEDSEESISPP